MGHRSAFRSVRQYYPKTKFVLDKMILTSHNVSNGKRRPRHRSIEDIMTTAPAALPRLSVAGAWFRYGALHRGVAIALRDLSDQQRPALLVWPVSPASV